MVLKILVTGLVVTRSSAGLGSHGGKAGPTGSGSEHPGFRTGLHHLKP